jgi:hypothetical protein
MTAIEPFPLGLIGYQTSPDHSFREGGPQFLMPDELGSVTPDQYLGAAFKAAE